MTEATNVALIGVFCSVVVAACAFVTFWLRFGDRISRAQADAAAALQEAAESKIELEQVRTLHLQLKEELTNFQLRVAKEYVDKDMMREVESRVIAAVEKAARASTEALAQLAQRIDGIADRRTLRQKS
jgi:hypothetical protein